MAISGKALKVISIGVSVAGAGIGFISSLISKREMDDKIEKAVAKAVSKIGK